MEERITETEKRRAKDGLRGLAFPPPQIQIPDNVRNRALDYYKELGTNKYIMRSKYKEIFGFLDLNELFLTRK